MNLRASTTLMISEKIAQTFAFCVTEFYASGISNFEVFYRILSAKCKCYQSMNMRPVADERIYASECFANRIGKPMKQRAIRWFGMWLQEKGGETKQTNRQGDM